MSDQVAPTDPPRYWFCIIGPVPESTLNRTARGADFPPRMAARAAVDEMLGDADKSRFCSSGWIHEAEYTRITEAQRRQD